ISKAELDAARSSAAQAKAKLAAAEADLDYLVGKTPKSAASTSLGEYRAAARLLGALSTRPRLGAAELHLYPDAISRVEKASEMKGPAVDRIRRALDRKVSLSVGGLSAKDVLARLRRENPDLHIQGSTGGSAWGEQITANLRDVPYGAVLQLLEDNVSGHRIVVREYGLLIVPQDKVPPGA